jgi:hypothetical protein
MYHTWKAVRVVACVLGGLAIVGLLLNPGMSQGQGNKPSSPVTVTNTPLPVTGTVAVTAGTPLAVTGNVNVRNTPYVRVNNSGEAFQAVAYFDICDGCLANGVSQVYLVPANKRAVIENVSLKVDDLDVADSLDAYLATTVGGTMADHFLGVAGPTGRVKIDSASHNSQFVSQVVRLYADTGDIGVIANRLARSPKVWVWVTISGHLEPIP